MIRLDQPLPDRRERPRKGGYKPQRAPRGGAYVPREVPTVDPREVAACAAAYYSAPQKNFAYFHGTGGR